MALSTASNWLWNFLLGESRHSQSSTLSLTTSGFFSPFIAGSIDFRYGYVFAGCNVIGGLLVYFFVIEGQGRTLEEIDTMYIEKITPWKSNKWVAPPPHEIARIRKAAGTHEGDEENFGVDSDALEKEDRGRGEDVNKETT
jgi:SP family sugar:H+ symporter-like MFS transporter